MCVRDVLTISAKFKERCKDLSIDIIIGVDENDERAEKSCGRVTWTSPCKM